MPTNAEFRSDPRFQDHVLAAMIKHPERFGGKKSWVKPEYFLSVASMNVCDQARKYEKKYGNMPGFDALREWVFDEFSKDDQERADEAASYVDKLATLDLGDLDYVVDNTGVWCQEQALINCIRDAANKIVESRGSNRVPVTEIRESFENALRAGQTVDAPKSVISYANEKIDNGAILLGNGFLERKAFMLIAGQTGIGKSSSGLQQNTFWAMGRPAFGIKPAKPLKILTIQSENNDNDLRLMSQGVVDGMEKMNVSDKDVELINENALYLHCPGSDGEDWLGDYVGQHLEDVRPDILRLDPLNLFLSGDPSDLDIVHPFIVGLLRLLDKYDCAAILDHHFPKSKRADREKWGAYDSIYAGTGSAHIQNSARAVINIYADSYPYFRFNAQKRGERCGWLDETGLPIKERWFKHASDGTIWWDEVDEVESAALRHSKNGKPLPLERDLLAILPERKSDTDAPRTLLMSATELRARARKEGWRDQDAKGLIDQGVREGWLGAIKGPRGVLLYGDKGEIKDYAGEQGSKWIVLG